MTYPILVGFLLVAAGSSAAVAGVAWRRRATLGAEELTWLMAGAAEWALAYALQIASSSLALKVFWARIEFLGHVAVPACWLLFAMRYTGRNERLLRWARRLLWIEPLVIMLAVATDDLHHRFWTYVRLDPASPVLERGFGPLWWADAAYSYTLLVIGSLLLLQALVNWRHVYRKQSAALLAGVAVPWAANAAFLFGLTPVSGLDLTPFVFPVAGGALAVGLFRFRLLDVVPMARDAVIEGLPDGVVVLDAQDRVLDLNPAARRILGQQAGQGIGAPADRVLPDAVLTALRNDRPAGSHTEVAFGNGSARRHYEVTRSALTDRGGRHPGRLIVLRDVSERIEAERRLAESEQRYRSLFAQHPDAVFSVDRDGCLLTHNAEVIRLTGYSDEELERLSIFSVVVPEDMARVAAHFAATLLGKPQNLDVAFINRAGERIEVNVTGVPIVVDGEVVGVYGIARDITEQMRAEALLREAEDKYRTLVEQIPAITYVTSTDGSARTLYISPQVSAVLGFPLQDWLATPTLWASLLHSEDRDRVLEANQRTNASGEPLDIEYRMIARDGRVVWFRDQAVLVRDADGRPRFWQGVMFDISDRKLLEERLAHQASHDPLTGLPNRTLFLDRLSQALQRARRNRTAVAVLFVDLDNFKVVNDTLGHDVGDRLLVAVAERIRTSLRGGDTAARFGGDEFTVLLEDLTSTDDAVTVAERMLTTLRVPYEVGGRLTVITPSIGVVLGNASALTPDELLRHADLAMYQAKSRGRSRYEVVDPEFGAREGTSPSPT